MMTPNQKRRIYDLREKGYSYAQVSVEMDMLLSTVKSFCRRHPFVPPPPVIPIPEPLYTPGLTCKQCGKPMLQREKTKKKQFCSDSCRMKWWNTHLELIKRKAYYDMTCTQCGISFQSYGNRKRKYCGLACSTAAHRKVAAS